MSAKVSKSRSRRRSRSLRHRVVKGGDVVAHVGPARGEVGDHQARHVGGENGANDFAHSIDPRAVFRLEYPLKVIVRRKSARPQRNRAPGP
jgi:hypothetical protein